MPNKSSLLIITPMQEENTVIKNILHDMGYDTATLKELHKEKKLYIYEAGMGGINILHFLYNNLHVFDNSKLDVVLTGFAGALNPDLHIGSSCQVANITDFTFFEHQGAGDFEIIQTPSSLFSHALDSNRSNKSISLPHLMLNPTDIGEETLYSIASVPALLQGAATKEHLLQNGIDLVDMEAFSLAATLKHIATTQDKAEVNLDVIKVITDSPNEHFKFSDLEKYKAHLYDCPLIRKMLAQKLATV